MTNNKISQVSRFALAFSIALVLCCEMQHLQVAGGSSGTEVSRVTGRAVDVNGAALSNAIVSIRPTEFLADSGRSNSYRYKHSIADTVTGVDGSFTFAGIQPGTYRIVIMYRDSLGSVMPLGVSDTSDIYQLPHDTLRPLATIAGVVALLKSDSLQSRVQFYGMDVRCIPDSNGQFMVRLPAGEHRIHIGAYEAGTAAPREFDRVEVRVGIDDGEIKDIGTFGLHRTATRLCSDGSCDSVVLRAVLDSLGLYATPVNSVGIVANGRIVALNFHGLPIGSRKIIHDIIRLFSVTAIDLGATGITSVFPEVTIMQKLTALRLDSNRIQSLPGDFGDLVNLTELALNNNELTTLPASIVSVHPGFLDLSGNRLVNLDSSITAWADLYDSDWRTSQK